MLLNLKYIAVFNFSVTYLFLKACGQIESMFFLDILQIYLENVLIIFNK